VAGIPRPKLRVVRQALTAWTPSIGGAGGKEGRMETLPTAPTGLVLAVAPRLRSNTVGVLKHGPGRLVPPGHGGRRRRKGHTLRGPCHARLNSNSRSGDRCFNRTAQVLRPTRSGCRRG
jgi:hypothetical protein